MTPTPPLMINDWFSDNSCSR